MQAQHYFYRLRMILLTALVILVTLLYSQIVAIAVQTLNSEIPFTNIYP